MAVDTPTASREEKLADDLFASVDTALDTGDVEPFHALFETHQLSQKITSVMTTNVLACILSQLHLSTKHIKALERRPAMKYAGVWSPSDLYAEGTFITHAGSLWYAKTASVSKRPGADDVHWVLCAKKGRDGRDGRDGHVATDDVPTLSR